MESIKIEEFIENICNQISEEKVAEEISMEMKDHIKSLIAEYIEKGLTEEKAVEKALNSMGDPRTIGKSLNLTHDKGNKGFIVITFIFLINFMASIYLIINKEINTIDKGFILIFLGFLMVETMSFIKLKKKVYSIEEEPIMVIRSKDRGLLQNILIVGLIFIVDATLLSIMYIDPKNIIIMAPYVSTVSIFVTYYSSTQPSIVYPSGIVTFGDFLSWKEVSSHVFVKTHTKKGDIHSLKLRKNKKWKELMIRVPNEQLKAVSEIIREKIM